MTPFNSPNPIGRKVIASLHKAQSDPSPNDDGSSDEDQDKAAAIELERISEEIEEKIHEIEQVIRSIDNKSAASRANAYSIPQLKSALGVGGYERGSMHSLAATIRELKDEEPNRRRRSPISEYDE